MPKLGIVIVSTREGRGGKPVADWFTAAATKHGKFDIETVDLKAIDLPMLEEPAHPRLKQYRSDKTKAWSATVTALDAFVFVTPEYNFGTPPSLLNAVDHLFSEWHYKAAGFVSYGGVSGGLRSVQMTKLVLTSLKVVPVVEAVALPFFAKGMNAETGTFDGGEVQEKAAFAMLDELLKWTNALAPLRA